MTAFATAEDVGIVLQRELSDTEAASATLLLDLASSEIEEAIGITFEGGAIQVSVPGNWGSFIDLPATPTSITSVSIDGTAVDVGGWFWRAGRRIRRGPGPGVEANLNDDNTRPLQGAQPTYGAWNWGGEGTTVTVVFVTSAVGVPLWLKSMAINLVIQALTNPAQVRSESLGAYSVSYPVGDTGSASVSLLNPSQHLMLQRRYRHGVGTIVPAVL